ncbi:hypothetical protein FQA39_LY05789 [Lamprigera yunnana]|nr:hypothetical protein FQA39_LY05789 [Lamprigera yunnana]
MWKLLMKRHLNFAEFLQVHKCEMCNKVDILSTKDSAKKQLYATTAAVSGIIYFEEITSPIWSRTFYKHQETVYTGIMALELDEMIEAEIEEKKLEIEADELDDIAVPVIIVVVDEQWSKQS